MIVQQTVTCTVVIVWFPPTMLTVEFTSEKFAELLKAPWWYWGYSMVVVEFCESEINVSDQWMRIQRTMQLFVAAVLSISIQKASARIQSSLGRKCNGFSG